MVGATMYCRKSGDKLCKAVSIHHRSVTDRRTDGRTDGRMNRIAIPISRVSIAVLTRDKNRQAITFWRTVYLRRGGGGGDARCNTGGLVRLPLLLSAAHPRVAPSQSCRAGRDGRRTRRSFLRRRHLPPALPTTCYLASLLRILQYARR